MRIVQEAISLPLYLLVRLINGEIEGGHQVFVHPCCVLGILVPEFPFSWKHKVYQQNTEEVYKNNLDGFPEFYNALDPIHGVKLEYLMQL